MAYFPFFVELSGQSGLIVGGGTVALRKAGKLLPYGPRLTVVAPDILTQLAADLQGIMTGELTVEEGLAEAEEYANNLLNEYWAEQG